MTMPDSTDEQRQHSEKMKRIKEAKDKILAQRQEERGLVIIHTGPGKGKSSAGFGMILRMIAHDMPSSVVQFVKGGRPTGERSLIQTHFAHLCRFHTMGEGFSWETQDRERDAAAARRGWDMARTEIRDASRRMVLLDEINIVIRQGHLDPVEVADFLLSEKPAMTHVVLTGRNAAPELIEIADLVTEMTLVRHPFRDGVKAQPGVEF